MGGSIVRDDITLYLWSLAQTRLEWATTRFWEHIIRSFFAANKGWVLSSQQPPTDEDANLRRVELALDQWKGKAQPMRRVFFFEGKKHGASATEIDNVEVQIYDACMDHLLHSRREYMYAMTAIGTRARFWIVHVDDQYPTPWVPKGDHLGDKSEYIEAHSSEGSSIEAALRHMKSHGVMPPEEVETLRDDIADRIERAGRGAASHDITYSPHASASAPAQPYSYPVTYSPHASASGVPTGSAALPIRSAPSTKHVETLPDNLEFAFQVEVNVEEKENAEDDILHFYHGGMHYSRAEKLWKDGIVKVDGKLYECVYYKGVNTGKYFWTYSISDLELWEGQGKEKGRGKGKGKAR